MINKYRNILKMNNDFSNHNNELRKWMKLYNGLYVKVFYRNLKQQKILSFFSI